jgi:hypothetical protein
MAIQIACRPWSLIEADAGIAIALDGALDDEEEIDPHGLRAGIAAPRAPDR